MAKNGMNGAEGEREMEKLGNTIKKKSKLDKCK